MTDVKDAGPMDEAVRDLLDMLHLSGLHEGHSLTREADTWVCSCGKRVRSSA